MVSSTFEGVIHDIRHKCTPIGQMVTVLVVHRDNEPSPYFCDINPQTQCVLSRGDRVRISSCDNNTSFNNVILLEHYHDENNITRYSVDINTTHCPYCHVPLSYDHGTTGICFNKTCKSQLVKNMMVFTNGIGLYYQDKLHYIYLSLLTRGVFYDYIDLFTLTNSIIHDLDSAIINEDEATLFIHNTNKYIGTITMFQLLNGLNIYNLLKEDIIEIVHKCNYTEFKDLLYGNNKNNVSDKVMNKLKYFSTISSNINSVIKLEPIMYNSTFQIQIPDNWNIGISSNQLATV